MLKKLKKYLIFNILILCSCSNPLESKEYFYSFKTNNSSCSKIDDENYSVSIDTNKFQDFFKFDINTNNSDVRYVNWNWQSPDTFYIFVNGVNAGPLPPTNKSSVISDGVGSTIFAFHKSSINDIITISASFIDSKINKHLLSKKNIFFHIKSK